MTGQRLECDVLVVGGRPAGASLAARLGSRGLRVIVIDRAEFPSLPTVPSCPIIYGAAMQLLEEIGVPESSYADPTAKVRAVVFQFADHFSARVRLPYMNGRDYVYGLDRPTFDDLVWRNLDRFPSVTKLSGCAMTELLRAESGRVIGCVGRDKDGNEVEITARCVVGADGRYSLVARKVGAKIVEDRSERCSTVYYAEWEGVAPVEPGAGVSIHVFTSMRGVNVLGFPMPGNRVTFVTHQRADRVDTGGDADGYYMKVLRSCPGVYDRLRSARQVSKLVGIKRVANRYLDFGGPGWVLVGDALHHKDPVDGQGIRDALIGGKLLAESLISYFDARLDWDRAIEQYRRRIMEETYAMFAATTERLDMELYKEPPELIIKTVIRGIMTDPDYQRRFCLFLGRVTPAETWHPATERRDAVLRSALRGARNIFSRR